MVDKKQTPVINSDLGVKSLADVCNLIQLQFKIRCLQCRFSLKHRCCRQHIDQTSCNYNAHDAFNVRQRFEHDQI